MQAKKLRGVRKLTWMESYLPKGAQIKKIRTHSIATGRLVAFGISARRPAPVKTLRCALRAAFKQNSPRSPRRPASLGFSGNWFKQERHASDRRDLVRSRF